MGLLIRRRTMIEVGGGGGLPQGCIFYAPLSQGNTADVVSGASAIVSGGTMTWDANYGMYALTIPANTTPCTAVYFDVDFSGDFSFSNSDEYTLYAKVVVPVVSNSRPYIVGLGNFNISTSYKPNFAGSAVLGIGASGSIGSMGSPQYAALVRRQNGSGGLLTYYSKNFNESTNSSHLSNPANWNSTNMCGQRVCLLFHRDAGQPSYTIYVKDLYVFNRALTQPELETL